MQASFVGQVRGECTYFVAKCGGISPATVLYSLLTRSFHRSIGECQSFPVCADVTMKSVSFRFYFLSLSVLECYGSLGRRVAVDRGGHQTGSPFVPVSNYYRHRGCFPIRLVPFK